MAACGAAQEHQRHRKEQHTHHHHGDEVVAHSVEGLDGGDLEGVDDVLLQIHSYLKTLVLSEVQLHQTHAGIVRAGKENVFGIFCTIDSVLMDGGISGGHIVGQSDVVIRPGAAGFQQFAVVIQIGAPFGLPVMEEVSVFNHFQYFFRASAQMLCRVEGAVVPGDVVADVLKLVVEPLVCVIGVQTVLLCHVDTRRTGGADHQAERAEDDGHELGENGIFHALTAPFHFVALAPDHLDVPGLGGIDLHLFTEVADVDGHGALTAQGGLLPDGFVEVLGGVDRAGIFHQQVQNGVFRGGQGDCVAVDGDGFGLVVQRNGTDGDDAGVLGGAAAQEGIAAQLAADPGQDLHGDEGLGDVIVGAHIQAQNLILGLGLGSQENDGDVGKFPDLSGGGDAVHLGHHDVQKDQVQILLPGQFQGLPAGGGGEEIVALGGQIYFQRIDNVRLVVADENVVHGRTSIGDGYIIPF